MKRQTYSMDSICRSLSMFEERYGMSSSDFYAAYKRDDDDIIGKVPGFDRRVWESLYVEASEDGPSETLPTDTGELTPA
jgi:hypothetical protein